MRNWEQSPKGLITARAYAASVVLPDGRFWIIGGADERTVLQTTEFLTLSDAGITGVEQGPTMIEPLMSHCAALVSPTQVLVLGGFSSVISDYTPTAAMYDLTLNEWKKMSWTNPGPRIDGACLNVGSGGQRNVLLAGGWNNAALKDSAIFSNVDQRWKILNGTTINPDPLLNPLRSSVLVERNMAAHLLGGVTCQGPDGRGCKQTDQGLNIHLDTYT